ncbi:MAG: sugar phosphate isomerase/epimerase [Bacillota bacterium]|nr:sugar phosphate isomerase/epimerase [Bacillota bacterium]
MKLGVLTVPLYDMSLEDTVKYLSSLGVEALELGTGGSPGKKHLNPDEMTDERIAEVKKLVKDYNMEIAALSCHGNCVHPDPEVSGKDQADFEKTVLLAEKMGIDTIVTFGGCPGDGKGGMVPNWVTCTWPKYYSEMLKWQWEEVLIPYWKKACEFANAHGVTKIALEMHPGFAIYNPITLLKLREAVGDTIGANFDPSHLFWQGINPADAIREMKGAIYHFHAKDTKIDARNTAISGVLETRGYASVAERAWSFRTVGYGHDALTWKEIISALAVIGYQGAVSIEHEDALMTPKEGLEKAIEFLKPLIIKDKSSKIWWA